MNCNFKSLVVLVLCLCCFLCSCGKKQILFTTSELLTKFREATLKARLESEKVRKQLEAQKEKNERLQQKVNKLYSGG